MAKRDDIPKIDPSEIEALIKRLKQSNIEPREFCARGVFGARLKPRSERARTAAKLAKAECPTLMG